jgi:EmrB/QacA subfamily drug resistance transporter
MAYLLVLTIFATQVGRLGDMYGRVRMYNLGFAIFTLGSLLCGLSQTGPEIIGFRIVQGFGGALVYSNSSAIIADTLPAHKRGRGFGITGMGYSIGAILGILAGGAIITFLSWRYIFFINVPIGVAAVIVSYLVLRERSVRIKARIDVAGMALLGAGLLLILYALTKLTGTGWSDMIGFQLFGGGALIAAFVAWERFYSAPLLDLKMFSERVFSASVFAAFFQGLANFAVLFLIIMYLQGVRGLSPFYSSLLLIPGYLLGGVTAPLAGRSSDKYGARIVASLGLALQACGVLVYYSLSVDSTLWIIVVGSVINGAGSSSFYPANISAVMANTQPKAYGVASGLLRTFSNAGMVSSFAVALLIASLSIPRQQAFAIFLGVNKLTQALSSSFVTGMHAALLTSIALTMVALVLSIFRGKETRTNANSKVSH